MSRDVRSLQPRPRKNRSGGTNPINQSSQSYLIINQSINRKVYDTSLRLIDWFNPPLEKLPHGDDFRVGLKSDRTPWDNTVRMSVRITAAMPFMMLYLNSQSRLRLRISINAMRLPFWHTSPMAYSHRFSSFTAIPKKVCRLLCWMVFNYRRAFKNVLSLKRMRQYFLQRSNCIENWWVLTCRRLSLLCSVLTAVHLKERPYSRFQQLSERYFGKRFSHAKPMNIELQTSFWTNITKLENKTNSAREPFYN